LRTPSKDKPHTRHFETSPRDLLRESRPSGHYYNINQTSLNGNIDKS
jgi:hypothetical protein